MQNYHSHYNKNVIILERNKVVIYDTMSYTYETYSSLI